MSSFLFTINNLEKRRDLDQIRWSFQMVYWWVVVTNLRPQDNGQRVSGRRLSPAMKEDLNAWLSNMSLDTDFARARLTQAQVVDKVSDWSKCGSAIVDLENKIGKGCLFYIGHVLDENL